MYGHPNIAPGGDFFNEIWPGDMEVAPAVIDASAEPPANQHAYLVAMLELDDWQHPAGGQPVPPYGEPTDLDEYISETVLEESYRPLADVEAAADADLLGQVSDAFPADYPAPFAENDPQYFGLGVPPGIENLDQPIEFGRTQAVPEIPSEVHGWDAWSGRPQLARVARHENYFRDYNDQIHRRMGEYPVEKLEMPLVYQTQQYRDMMLVELKRRGVHEAVVSDVSSVPFTAEVLQIDPLALAVEAPIGPEGVLP